MREQLFQYQDQVDPIQAGAAPETITLDKWSPSLPEPRRPRRLLNRGSIVSVEALLTGTAQSLLEHLSLAVSGQKREARQAPGSFLVETPAAAAPGGFEWLTSALSVPQRPRRQPRHQYLFFLDIFPVRPPAPDSSGWARELSRPVLRRRTRVQISQTHAFVHAPSFTVVTFTPTGTNPGRPATRNKLFWKLPDLGTLSLRTDRLTGQDKEARLRAPESLEDDYTLIMPTGLPDANRLLKVDAEGNLVYGAQSLTASTTWDPVSLNNNQQDTKTVSVPGAAVGDPVFAGFTTALSVGMFLHASVTATDVVTVVLVNSFGGAAQDLASGTLTVAVLKQ